MRKLRLIKAQPRANANLKLPALKKPTAKTARKKDKVSFAEATLAKEVDKIAKTPTKETNYTFLFK